MTSTPEQMMLKPCPFCGSAPELVSGGPGNHFVVCRTCKASGADRAAENAIAAWNRRSLSEGQKPVAPGFEGVAKRKLEGLLSQGWEISGYSVFKEGRHGFVTAGAFVGWWSPDTAAPVSQPEQKPVAVKVLEWEDNQATTPFGTYTVTDDVDDLWHFTFHSYPYGVEDDRGYGREAFAKAAAQSDYETRIRSALVDSHPVAVKDDTARSPLASVTEQVVEAASRLGYLGAISRLEEIAFADDSDDEYSSVDNGDLKLVLRTARIMSRGLRAALSSPQSQPHPVAGEAWQPIETAPKDKTELLVAIVGHPPIRAKQTAGGTWLAFPYGPTPPLVGGMLPTHWQPLPAPPVPEQGADG